MICKKSSKGTKDQHINDVYYEFDTNSPNSDCDESVSETAFALINDSIFPTSTLSGSINDNTNEPTHTVATNSLEDFDGFSTRKPRSENTDEIVPTSILNFDPKHSPKTETSAEERQNNNPNADIQDIITGIVKLLNGNVNVHANTQFAPQTTRRYATRINNRGPPRISDLPIILPIEEKYPAMQKTTPYPSGLRKPPTVPYPFDLPPPEKPLRNEHTILMHNKPMQPNRPPWHGSRTRPPIQITNTNRLQIPTRVSMNMPIQPTQDYRPPSKSVNPMTTYSTRLPDINKMPEMYSNEKPALNVMEHAITMPNNQLEQNIKEVTRKTDTLKKATRIPSIISSPIVESYKVIPEMTTTSIIITTTTTTTTTEAVDIPITTAMTAATTSVQKSTTPTMIAQEKTKSSTPFTQISQSSAELESTKTPELPQSANKAQESASMAIKTTETIQSSIKNTISPSRVSKPNQQIESTDFKSFYARPGIVLDDTDYTPGALEPSTKPHFHHVHRNTGAHSSATLSNIYAEIFDVTLSAIQGQPGHNKVVDLIEIGNTDSDPTNVIATKFYGTDGNDIIVSASDDNSFVSIDGKRTYINLFGETAETEHLKKPLKTQNDQRVYQQASKTVRLCLYCFLIKICFAYFNMEDLCLIK